MLTGSWGGGADGHHAGGPVERAVGEGSQTHLVSVPQMLLGMGLIIASQARSSNSQMPMQGLGPLCSVVMFHAMFVLSHTAFSTTGGP